jgi:hypothetical protein
VALVFYIKGPIFVIISLVKAMIRTGDLKKFSETPPIFIVKISNFEAFTVAYFLSPMIRH